MSCSHMVDGTLNENSVKCPKCGKYAPGCQQCGSIDHAGCFDVSGAAPRFFDEYEVPTSACHDLSSQAEEALKPIVAEWVEKGHATRDIHHVISNACAHLTQMAHLRRREGKPKKKPS